MTPEEKARQILYALSMQYKDDPQLSVDCMHPAVIEHITFMIANMGNLKGLAPMGFRQIIEQWEKNKKLPQQQKRESPLQPEPKPIPKSDGLYVGDDTE